MLQELFIIFATGAFLYFVLRSHFAIVSNWNDFFPYFTFSSDQFYKDVKQKLMDLKLDAVSITQESFRESHLFSGSRLYLRVSFKEYYFYIGASQFASGMFVSWWLCNENDRFINRIPVISKMLGMDRNKKTFYQMDLEYMYRSGIHSAIIEVCEEYKEAKGYKMPLTTQQYKDIIGAPNRR